MHTETHQSRQLWEQFRSGNAQAFEMLYRLYAPVLLSYAGKLTNDENLLQDAMQELFTRLWNNRQTVNQPQNVQAYLLSSLRREIIRHLQKDLPETLHDETTGPTELSAEEQLIQRQQEKQRSQLLIEAVRGLPARQQEAIFLKYYTQLSFQEIAEVMEISIKGVYKIIYKAIDNLKENSFLQKLFSVTAVVLFAGVI